MCVRGQDVSVRIWSAHTVEQGRQLEEALAISQAIIFQILTINLLFILHSTVSQICVLNIVKSSIELVIQSEYRLMYCGCIKQILVLAKTYFPLIK